MVIQEPLSNDCDDKEIESINNKLIEEILKNEHFDSKTYKQLSEIIKLNPLLMEDKIKLIFRKILFIGKITNEEINSYTALLIDILDVSVSLRRENKLISWILLDFKESSIENSDNITLNEMFPHEFLQKFTSIVYNLTHKQINDIFLSFLFHFELISREASLDDNLNIWVGALVRLLIGFFEGVHIFDYSAPLNQQQKFINILIKFGNILDKQIQLINYQNNFQLLAHHLLEIIKSWETVVAFMKHFALQCLTEEHLKTISDILESIKTRLVDLSNKFEENKRLEQLVISCQFEINKINNNSLSVDSKIFNDIKHHWEFLFDEYPNVVSQLKTLHYFILAPHLISNYYLSKKKGSKAYINSFIVQENESFISAIIYTLFFTIDSKLNIFDNVSKQLLNKITQNRLLWEKEKMEKILSIIEESLSEPVWQQYNHLHIKYFKKYLQVFLHLPLIYLNNKLRNIIFIVIFTIYNECEQSKDLCMKILSDTMESGNIDILKYIPLKLFADKLPLNSVVLKAFQSSIRYVSNYNSVEKFIRLIKNTNHTALPVLLESFHKVKLNLKIEDKMIALKIEKKLFKQMLKVLEDEVKTFQQLKNLGIVLKIAISLKKLDDCLTNKINSTIDFILKENLTENNSMEDNFKEESLNLLRIVFQNRSIIPINKDIHKEIWMLMLKNPCEIITMNLIEITCDELFKKILNILNKQTIKSTDEKNKLLFDSSIKVWCILSSQLRIQYSIMIQQHLEMLIQHFIISDLTPDQCLIILQLSIITIKTNRTPISEGIIDLIFIFSNELLSKCESNGFIYEKLAEICFSFVKFRSEILTDRLPPLISLYKMILKFIVSESRKDISVNKQQIQCLALDALKISTGFIKIKKDMIRVSPYIIADIVALYSEGVIPSQIKDTLDNCLFTFLSICDQHAIPFLCRNLPAAMQQIFKNLYETYNKFYKFTGKI